MLNTVIYYDVNKLHSPTDGLKLQYGCLTILRVVFKQT